MSASPLDTMLISVGVTAGHAVCVCLAGDVDLPAEPDLASLRGHAPTLAAVPA